MSKDSTHSSLQHDAPAAFERALSAFENLYRRRWRDARVERTDDLFRVSSATRLRPDHGNHPKILHHGRCTDDVAVLIHGITDSPFYVEAIGRRLHAEGFNVVLPLLPAHGVREPWQAMRELEHQDWIRDVDEVVKLSLSLGQRLSMGGFSTGGALTIHKVVRDRRLVTGGIYLFSAALDIGDHNETLLESFAGEAIGRTIDLFKFGRSTIREKFRALRDSAPEEDHDPEYGIGDDPCKYSVFFYEGASELAEVVDEIDDYYDARGIKPYSDIRQPSFVAHSRTDEQALFHGASSFYDNHPNDKKAKFFMTGVEHSSLVVERPIVDAAGNEIVAPNPRFDDMMKAMIEFTRKYVTHS